MTTAPTAPAPDKARKLKYPMASDYVKDWTAKRALKELVSNAIDASPTYSVTWSAGLLTIEDDGHGIPYAGLLFGGSTKDSRHIGQFGEGKKLALLVLARDSQIGAVAVETVGYGFSAELEDCDLLKNIGAPGSTNGTRVLTLTFTESLRVRGTRITVECDQQLAEELLSEIRYLNEANYIPPQITASIVLDGQPGRIWVGGILVTTDDRLVASYDLPLATAKAHQNRDRTIVSSRVLEQHIQAALAHCTNPEVLKRFVDHALNDGELAGPEAFFTSVTSYEVRQAFREIGQNRWPDGRVYHNARDLAQEAELGLQDRGWKCVTSGLNPTEHRALMHLLGVGDPPHAEAASRTRETPTRTTIWTTTAKLSHTRRRTLDLARGIMEATFERGCLGTLRVFTHHDAGLNGCSARGAYWPTTDTVGIQDHLLDDLPDTLRTLFHEHGHRYAARTPGFESFFDRTREFERALCIAASIALTQLGNREHRMIPLVDPEVWDAENLPAGAYLTIPHRDANPVSTATLRREHAKAQAPEPRRLLADLATARLASVREETGKNLAELIKPLALETRHLGLITRPHPAGYRRRYGFATLPEYAKSEALGRLLGIHPPVLYLAHIAVEGPLYNVRNKRDLSWREPLASGAASAARDLRELGGAYAAQADAIEAMAAGRTPYDAEGKWLAPVTALVKAEMDRLK
ncbi:ATP-binding protein [Streptomyces sp. NPDC001165]|uniref:ATP-binding protein n=1 Tax=Streptomyces sp. NPDC001165 TaxID=3364546 RepID=UPI0036B9AE15